MIPLAAGKQFLAAFLFASAQEPPGRWRMQGSPISSPAPSSNWRSSLAV
jgi:hypothetical protein